MKHDFIDHHSHGHSALHHLHPGAKLVMVSILLLCIITVPPAHYRLFVLFAALLLCLLVATRVPLPHTFSKGVKLLPFILILILFVPFFKEGSPLWQRNIGGVSVRITREGADLFLNILCKSVLAVFSVVLLNLTTPFHVLLKGMQAFGAPRIMTDTLAVAYRYLFVIVDEKDRMLTARKSRRIYPSFSLEWRSLAQLLGVLFLRSYERGERMYMAMCSRGFNGTIVTLDEPTLTFRDWLWVGGVSLAALSIRVYGMYD